MTKWDKYLIFLISIVSISSMFYIKNLAIGQGDKYVVVEVNGSEYKKITFSNDDEIKHLDINTKYGYNELEIQDGRVRVIEASCKDKLDVKQGFIKDVGEVIVCLPNRLVVEIKGEKILENNIDAGSY